MSTHKNKNQIIYFHDVMAEGKISSSRKKELGNNELLEQRTPKPSTENIKH
jgi:hypothetical protein